MTGISDRVPGHTLRYEGAAHDDVGNRWDHGTGPGRGLCSCGTLSDPLVNRAARKRWHREHKAEVRAAASP